MSRKPQQLSIFKQAKRRPITADQIWITAVHRDEPDVELVARALIRWAQDKAGVKPPTHRLH